MGASGGDGHNVALGKLCDKGDLSAAWWVSIWEWGMADARGEGGLSGDFAGGFEGDAETGVGGAGKALQRAGGGADSAAFEAGDDGLRGSHGLGDLLLGEVGVATGFDEGEFFIPFCNMALWLGRRRQFSRCGFAFAPAFGRVEGSGVGFYPGASPQAGIGRASGAWGGCGLGFGGSPLMPHGLGINGPPGFGSWGDAEGGCAGIVPSHISKSRYGARGVAVG
jgi:hypothetical protein